MKRKPVFIMKTGFLFMGKRMFLENNRRAELTTL